MAFCSCILKFGPVLHQIEVSGDSIELLMRCESVASPRRFLNHVFIIFIWEKEHFTESDSTVGLLSTLVGLLKFGHIDSNIELVDNSFNFSFMSSFT